MPYAVQPPAPEGVREALAEARWTEMVAMKPDLAPAVQLQRQLIGAVLRLTAAFEAMRPPKLSLPPRYVTAKLSAGIPALVAEPIPIPSDRLAPALVELCRILASHGGEAGTVLQETIEGGRLDLVALLTLTLRREQAALRAVATKAGIGHDLLWLVADLAVGPYAHVLRGTLFDAAPADGPLRAALDAWSPGYCPLCGSWPAVAEVFEGRRLLRCAFCAAGWEPATAGCAYCGDAMTVRALESQAQTGRAIETCDACRGYLKRVAVSAPMPFPLLPLDDLDSMDLDLAAMNAGFARPAIKAFGAR
jgi:FdhE protein